ncbi:hypothetical protein ANT2_0117 [plant metagenome]|uniref:Uncharacterized protein n=1 Tax=plant metagenome TaxID=1297885 RepID=A0A484S858_9ZZZZ
MTRPKNVRYTGELSEILQGAWACLAGISPRAWLALQAQRFRIPAYAKSFCRNRSFRQTSR